MKHELKCWPQFFDVMFNEKKNFDYRKNDRNFSIDDDIRFREFDPQTNEYTGRTMLRVITYILENEINLPDGYCILGLWA